METSSYGGRVVEASGNTAKATLTNEGTSVSLTATTTASVTYVFEAVQAGRCRIEIETTRTAGRESGNGIALTRKFLSS